MYLTKKAIKTKEEIKYRMLTDEEKPIFIKKYKIVINHKIKTCSYADEFGDTICIQTNKFNCDDRILDHINQIKFNNKIRR